MSKLKRLAAPNFWPIEMKTKKYVAKPRPGPHSIKVSMPLALVIRDVLGYAETLKEVDSILNKGIVKVDWSTRKDHGFPVGLMDIIEVGDEIYRVLAGKKGIYRKWIEKKEAFKLARIENKTSVRGGKTQLNLHDGRNIIVEKDDYKTGDVIEMSSDRKIRNVFKFEKDSAVLIANGKNTGSLATLKKIVVTRSAQPNIAVVSIEGKEVPVPDHYLFVVGKDKPVISL